MLNHRNTVAVSDAVLVCQGVFRFHLKHVQLQAVVVLGDTHCGPIESRTRRLVMSVLIVASH